MKADHLDNALRAAIKALDEVVAPAVDGANPLAAEQLKLVSRFLGFLRGRLPVEGERDRFELHHYLGLARQLRPLAAAAALPGLSGVDGAIEIAAALAERVDATRTELRAATDALTIQLSMLARRSAGLAPALRQPIERAVIVASKQLLDAQRAYYLPFGFEPDAARVPDLAAALAARP